MRRVPTLSMSTSSLGICLAELTYSTSRPTNLLHTITTQHRRTTTSFLRLWPLTGSWHHTPVSTSLGHAPALLLRHRLGDGRVLLLPLFWRVLLPVVAVCLADLVVVLSAPSATAHTNKPGLKTVWPAELSQAHSHGHHTLPTLFFLAYASRTV